MSIIKQKVVIGDCVLYQGDCIEVMRGMAENSVDSIVCDPPYLLGFMGKAWDAADGIAGQPEVWREALRVLKPGGHLLAFGAPRTNHRMVTAIEDAGFEIRDSVMWVFASGFPKSLDVSKAIDKAAGAERDVLGTRQKRGMGGSGTFAQDAWTQSNRGTIELSITAPATEAAKQWQGWGTALKPAYEPICVARKPLAKGNTVAANVLQWGTGGINIDGCRIGAGDDRTAGGPPTKNPAGSQSIGGGWANDRERATGGRWPANLIHDGSPEVLAGFPETGNGSGKPRVRDGSGNELGQASGWKKHRNKPSESQGYSDGGTAARFFYCAKASKKDRHEGLTIPGNKFTHGGHMREVENMGADRGGNFHPTVKPTSLMTYLCRLVTPPGGIVLDIFMGSGSTGKAAALEGFAFTGIEMDAGYFAIACKRIEQAHSQGRLFQSERAAQVQEVLA